MVPMTPEKLDSLNTKQREIYSIVLLEKILNTLEYLERASRPIKPLAEVIEFEVYSTNDGIEERMSDMKLQLGKNALIKVKGFKDAAGNPASVDGDKVEFAVKGDLNLGELVVAEDGMSATFVRNGAVGTVVVQLTADADLGPDVKAIMGEVQLDCMGGEAVIIELEATEVDPA